MNEPTEYATTQDTMGCDYRIIEDTLTLHGFAMNHSSARNYVIRGLKKIARRVLQSYDLDASDAKVHLIARNPKFQAALAEILRTLDDDVVLK